MCSRGSLHRVGLRHKKKLLPCYLKRFKVLLVTKPKQPINSLIQKNLMSSKTLQFVSHRYKKPGSVTTSKTWASELSNLSMSRFFVLYEFFFKAKLRQFSVPNGVNIFNLSMSRLSCFVRVLSKTAPFTFQMLGNVKTFCTFRNRYNKVQYEIVQSFVFSVGT